MPGPADGALGPCPLCGRPMLPGPSVDRHHWVPRADGGRDWGWMHRICHKKIHAVIDRKTLARDYTDAARLRAHPEIAAFIKWVRRKHPEFTGRHR